MAKARCFALLTLLSVGCGEDEPEATLAGAWILPSDGGYECAYGIVFNEDETYMETTICSLTGGGLGAEAYGGTYTARGDEITLQQTLGTCEADRLTVVVGYELDGDALRLWSPAQTQTLERIEDDGDDGTSQVTFGCYAQDGSFTPSPIREL